MSELRNGRHERFVQGVAEGKSGKTAYVEAGFSARDHVAEVEASRLLRNPKVVSRLAELRSEVARRNEITVDAILGELEEARRGAIAHKQYAAAVQAAMGRAKLAGLIVDRAEIDGSLRKPLRAPLSPSELKQPMSLEEWTAKFGPRSLVRAVESDPNGGE